MNILRVKAHPGARKEKLVRRENGTLEIWVKDQAQKGQANRRILEVISKEFGLASSDVRMVKGGKGNNKTFIVNKGNI
ncbi:MAG: DUF167 domain-containing protein [Candidatus Paceibacterota bacterium]